MKKQIVLIGIGSGWGAPDQRTARGAEVVINHLRVKNPTIKWTLDYFHENNLLPKTAIKPFSDYESRKAHVTRAIDVLALRVQAAISGGYFPIVIGGDHSLAMGTWAGVRQSNMGNDFSLLWFDAHMDANTEHTTVSMAPHGMPVAALLGHGYEEWTKTHQNNSSILKADNIYQFGIRSYDTGEENFLNTHNVHIDYATNCAEHGLENCIKKVMNNLTTSHYGVSIDVDAFDPTFAPGTGTTEPNGLNPNDMLSFLSEIAHDDRCLALEIMEFNPDKDIRNQTLHWIVLFIEAAMGAQPNHIKGD
ncbi:MAG: arginase [Pseudomonadota bacterium]